MNDVKKTQHYSNNELLLDGLLSYLPKDFPIIEPFYGNGDLVQNLEISEYYDIAFPQDNPHYRDTLSSPPSYNGKIIITNPPYLAKNKATDKTIFNQYDYDDLYKIAMSTMLQAEGGILIIPINFFTDEKSKKIRSLFLENFLVERLNIYRDGMFDTTNYNVCSFVFKKQKNKEQNIKTYIYENRTIVEESIFSLNKKYDYRLGGEFFHSLRSVNNLFTRLIEGGTSMPTHINVVCIDKVNDPLHFYYSEMPYYGKKSDRNDATLCTATPLTEAMEIAIIEEANKIISDFRKEMSNLVFTNFRDRNRKRIGFTEAYQIASLAYDKIKKSNN